MRYDPKEHCRRSVRLFGYDYSQEGAYFVTVCTQGKICLFGDVVDGEMLLNEVGDVIQKWYREIEKKFPGVQCDEYVIMPNHIHFAVVVGADLCVRPGVGENLIRVNASLNSIVQWFKTMTTNEYIRNVKQNGWKRFQGRLWQRNYYEHVVRDEDDMNRIREYINSNPERWEWDEDNPERKQKAIGLREFLSENASKGSSRADT